VLASVMMNFIVISNLSQSICAPPIIFLREVDY
jgi:hypothetical protein